jgi:uncharacterized SAM-binding protein YcdF (DUF218 family)
MKKFFGWLVAIIILLAVIGFAAFIGVGYYLSPQQSPQKADAIVVVSGGQTTTRAEKGIELFKQGIAKNIIFSGAALGDGPSNALAMREQAISQGISRDNIFIDEISQNTYENALNSKKILEDLKANKIILVTSPYHQRRANQTFRAVLGSDYEVIGVSAFDDRWSKSQWWRRGFPLFITVSELWKLAYVNLTGSYK